MELINNKSEISDGFTCQVLTADQYWYHSCSSCQGDSNIRPDVKENKRANINITQPTYLTTELN